MPNPTRHVTRCVVAGVVALLPIAGTMLAISWLESALTSSWRAQVPFYFPGLGILLALLAIYLVGLCVTTFVGRWFWRRVDRLLTRLPLLGTVYDSLKEILGYDSSRERFFHGVVAVPCVGGHELGFLTGECSGPDGGPRALVFVPGAPNPMTGRLVMVEPTQLLRMPTRAAEALRVLVSLGKTSHAGPRS